MANPDVIRDRRQRTNLDLPVTYRVATYTQTQQGENEVSYTDHKVWAKRLEDQDDLSVVFDSGIPVASQDVASHQYLMRFLDGATPGDVVAVDGRGESVRGIATLERRRWMIVTTQGASPSGGPSG